MKTVAIIPARGGSKRILKKNIKEFCGKPIIAYSIELALKSGVFDQVVVSSDDDEILEVAKKYGAQCLKRSQELGRDDTPTLPVIAEAIKMLGLSEDSMICCLYATAPLLEESYFLHGKMILEKNPNKSYAFSVVEFESSPLRGFSIQEDIINLLFPQYQVFRSQDLDKIYHDAGAFYWGYAKSFLEQKPIFDKDSIPIVLPKLMAQDIDTIDDWNLAEIKYNLKYA